MDWRVGIDVGGTFTDFVLFNEKSEEMEIFKHPTTPDDPSEAVLSGLNRLLNKHDIHWSNLSQIIHGTTIATNTVLERDGANAALIITEGFRDVPILGRQKRYDVYDLFLEKPDPIVPREDIYEVTERIHPRFGEIESVDPDQIHELGETLSQRYDSVAISFLHSYLDDSHEREVAAILRKVDPSLYISCSSQISKQHREYERTNTAMVDAYVKPKVQRYIQRIETALHRHGYQGNFLMMKSNGGIITSETVQKTPVQIVESGPVAGALNSKFVSGLHDLDRVFSFDMGGTTAKISFIVNGEPKRTDVFEIDKLKLKEGSGLPINLEVLDLVEIGAGGGSVATCDGSNKISVGPESAGADPGPICYAKGGNRPTVTDANLLLGYLDPSHALGGEMSLDKDGARSGVEDHLAQPLNLSVEGAAWGLKEVVENTMTQASKIHAAERGLDTRNFGLIAFGGAGPMHAAFIARHLSIPEVVVPRGAGVSSAHGLLVADVEFHLSQTQSIKVNKSNISTIDHIYRELDKRAKRLLENESLVLQNVQRERSADLKFKDQHHELEIPFPSRNLERNDVQLIKSKFSNKYRDTYGYVDETDDLIGVTWKTRVMYPIDNPKANYQPTSKPNLDHAFKGNREAYFGPAHGFLDTSIYDRHKLPANQAMKGPAIIEEANATTVVPPGDTITMDTHGDLVIDIHS